MSKPKPSHRIDIEKRLKLAVVVKQLSEILRQKPDAEIQVFDMDATPIGGFIDKFSYNPDTNCVVIETIWNY